MQRQRALETKLEVIDAVVLTELYDMTDLLKCCVIFKTRRFTDTSVGPVPASRSLCIAELQSLGEHVHVQQSVVGNDFAIALYLQFNRSLGLAMRLDWFHYNDHDCNKNAKNYWQLICYTGSH